ncbi:ribonuclease Z [Candidatus Woesearchaeota archaeon]|nr:ribonuclease Z [Candidatus Woesearchaeota archaeon]
MQLIVLGTGGMVPTKERNVSAIFLQFKEQGMLFDCGEGTQRQMNIASLKRTSVTKVFLTHWHGDHVSGLIGLLQTLGNEQDAPRLEIYGPPGTEMRMKNLLNTCCFDLSVELIIKELTGKKIAPALDAEEFTIEYGLLDHKVACIGYAFIEKDKRKINMDYLRKQGVPEGPHLRKLQDGKSITWKGKEIDVEKATSIQKGRKWAYVTDTAPCTNAVLLAQDADVLVCEATYAEALKEKAEEYKHMTAKDAALIAQQANVKKLVLTHFSQRYKTTEEIEQDARTYFPNVICAYDFMKITL